LQNAVSEIMRSAMLDLADEGLASLFTAQTEILATVRR